MVWYGLLLGLAAAIRGPFALAVLEIVGGMTFVTLAVDLRYRAAPYRPNPRIALGVAAALLLVWAALSASSFTLALQGGGPEFFIRGVRGVLFCGEAVLGYFEERSRFRVPPCSIHSPIR